MTTPAFEHFLARLYVEADVRRRFLADARGTAVAAGLDAEDVEALVRIDRTGLELAARSYAHKRERSVRRDGGWLARLSGWFHML